MIFTSPVMDYDINITYEIHRFIAHTHVHTDIYIYIYIYSCARVYVQ